MAKRNPFEILGVSEDCNQDELYAAYKNLRNKYADQRFEPGEAGAEACVKMQEIEDAYNDANDIIASRYEIKYTGDDLSAVDTAIKAGNLEEAQNILDNCIRRTAKWHYLQSAVFFRKNWVGDAYKQLEIACQMEPDNEQFKEAKKAMATHIKANSTTQDNSFYNENNKEERTYVDMSSTRNSRGCDVCDVCSALLCADCCCECMGGDLISCC